MKAMTAIVHSIKGENAGAESSALKTSALGCIKKGLSAALVTAMLTTMLASCDMLQENVQGPGEDGSTIETLAEGETVPYYDWILPSQFGLEHVFKEFDITNLYYGTEGHEFLGGLYENFLEEEKNNPGAMFVDYDMTNYFYKLTSGAEDRRNVIWELSDSDEKHGWSHTLVSTADDFALVSKNKSKYFVTGLVNGKLYDDAYTMGSEAYNDIQQEIKNKGYEHVLNTVRDEFFGIMQIYASHQNDMVYLAYDGKIDNMYDENGELTLPSERIYTMRNIYINSQETGKTIATITPTYDIPDNYIDQFIENKNYGGNHGRPHGNNNHWQDGEFVPGQDGAN